MKTITTTKAGCRITLIYFILLIIMLIPVQPMAQELEMTDADNDGIPAYLEFEPLCLPFGTDSLTNCYLTDPQKADVFVIMELANPTFFPENLSSLSFITDGEKANPHINLHIITAEEAPEQIVISPMFAVKLTENTIPTDGAVGISSTGTTSEKNYAYVYTQRIIDDVYGACNLAASGDQIYLALGAEAPVPTTPDEIAQVYMLNVAAHETFHMLGRVMPPDRKVGEHYNQQGYIMDHHMYYTAKKGKVTWYITDAWADADVPRFK